MLLPNFRKLPSLTALEEALQVFLQACAERPYYGYSYGFSGRDSYTESLEKALAGGPDERRKALQGWRQNSALSESMFLTTEAKVRAIEKKRVALAKAVMAAEEDLKNYGGYGDNMQVAALIRHNVRLAGGCVRQPIMSGREPFVPRGTFEDALGKANLIGLENWLADLETRLSAVPPPQANYLKSYRCDFAANSTRPQPVDLPDDESCARYPVSHSLVGLVRELTRAGELCINFASTALHSWERGSQESHTLGLLKILANDGPAPEAQKFVDHREEQLERFAFSSLGYQEGYRACWDLRVQLLPALVAAVAETKEAGAVWSKTRSFNDHLVYRTMLVNCAAADMVMNWSGLTLTETHERMLKAYADTHFVKRSDWLCSGQHGSAVQSVRGFIGK